MGRIAKRPNEDSDKKHANMRTEGQRERDRQFVASRYRKGWPIKDIHEKLEQKRDYSISYSTVWADKAKVIERWQEQQVKSVDRRKVIELEKLNQLEREAYEGWERSIGMSKEEVFKYDQGEGDQDNPERRIKQVEKAGDPRFLDTILDVIDKRCQILGLDAPEQHEVKGIIADVSSVMEVSEEEKKEARQLLGKNPKELPENGESDER